MFFKSIVYEKNQLHFYQKVQQRQLTAAVPKETLVTDDKGEKLADVKSSWDSASHTLFLSFEIIPRGQM